MSTHTPLPSPSRTGKRSRTTPASAGLPDPRPLTGYVAEYKQIGVKSRVTVTLDQPCVIRAPDWGFIDCTDGSEIKADAVHVLSNTVIEFDFDGIIPDSVAFIDVPYQDIQVQNFQGGFVAPGGQWFRTPVMP